MYTMTLPLIDIVDRKSVMNHFKAPTPEGAFGVPSRCTRSNGITYCPAIRELHGSKTHT